jgi:hypothetical protein
MNIAQRAVKAAKPPESGNHIFYEQDRRTILEMALARGMGAPMANASLLFTVHGGSRTPEHHKPAKRRSLHTEGDSGRDWRRRLDPRHRLHLEGGRRSWGDYPDRIGQRDRRVAILLRRNQLLATFSKNFN